MTRRLILPLIAMIMSIPAGVFAQKVETGFIPKEITLGAQTYFAIKVTNGTPLNIPVDISVEGLQIEYANKRFTGEMTSSGQMTETMFMYMVKPLRSGTFTMPSFDIAVNNQPMKTPTAVLKVSEPTAEEAERAKSASRPYFLKLTSERTSAYPNELIPLSLEVYVRKPKAITEVGLIELEDERFVFQRFRLVDKRMTEDIGGLPFSKVVLNGAAFALNGTDPGKLSLGPAEMKVMIEGSRQFPGFRFGVFSEANNVSMQSESLEMEILPFPAAGKPATFTGIVGDFEMKVTPSLTKLTVGDPISLDIEVTGPGNYETLNAPNFLPASASQWRTYDPRKILDPAEEYDGVNRGKATFTQIVIPQEELTEIPPFELVAFNPVTKAYDTLRSSPIPITVDPDESTVTAIAPGLTLTPGGNFASTAVEAAKPAANQNDIVALVPGSPTWRKAPQAVTSEPIFWAAQSVPAIALITLLGMGFARVIRRRNGGRKKSGGQKSFATLRSQARDAKSERGEFYHAVSEALDAWKRDRETSSLSEGDQSLFTALESRCNWLLYGASSSDRKHPPAEHETREAMQILDSLK